MMPVLSADDKVAGPVRIVYDFAEYALAASAYSILLSSLREPLAPPIAFHLEPVSSFHGQLRAKHVGRSGWIGLSP
jgi:hypothetical protein